MKSCLMCKHFYYDGGSHGYSEMTPGWEAVLRCRKGQMIHAGGENLFFEVWTRQQLREALASAETCAEYEPEAA